MQDIVYHMLEKEEIIIRQPELNPENKEKKDTCIANMSNSLSRTFQVVHNLIDELAAFILSCKFERIRKKKESCKFVTSCNTL